jgi:hypothetical protein
MRDWDCTTAHAAPECRDSASSRTEAAAIAQRSNVLSVG